MGHNTKDARHWEWLQQPHGKPIYMQEVDDHVPDSVRFPLEEAKKLCGVQMFPSTFAYMSALAILQGYDEVRIFGVELSRSEYEDQANGYLFWFGFLRGRLGVENVDSAVLHLGRNIFDAPLYGYEGNYVFGVQYFQERAKQHDGNWIAADKNARNLRKAIEKAAERNDFEKVHQLVNDFHPAMMQCGEYAGRQAEAERYMLFGDRYSDRGGFEFAAATAKGDVELKENLIYIWLGKVEYTWNVWKLTGNPQGLQQMMMFLGSMAAAAEEVGALYGVVKENIEYINKYDGVVRAGGRVLLEAA